MVRIDLPGYVSRVELHYVTRVTRGTSSIAEGLDYSRYKCNINPTVNSFRDSYFYTTVQQWNSLPVKLRSIENEEHFKTDLKEHLWLNLGVKPDWYIENICCIPSFFFYCTIILHIFQFNVSVGFFKACRHCEINMWRFSPYKVRLYLYGLYRMTVAYSY